MREGEPIAGTISAIKVALEKINTTQSGAPASDAFASDMGAGSVRQHTHPDGVFPQYGEPYLPWSGNGQVYTKASNNGPANTVNDAYGLGAFDQGGIPAFNMGGDMDVSALNLEEFFSLPLQYQPAWMQYY